MNSFTGVSFGNESLCRILVAFWTDWCPPFAFGCKVQGKGVSELGESSRYDVTLINCNLSFSSRRKKTPCLSRDVDLHSPNFELNVPIRTHKSASLHPSSASLFTAFSSLSTSSHAPTHSHTTHQPHHKTTTSFKCRWGDDSRD